MYVRQNVYKMTVVCCNTNYAVASYLWSVTTVMTIDTMLRPEIAGERSIGENTGGRRVTHA